MQLTISRLGWKKKPLPAFIPLFPDSLVLPAPFAPCSLLLNEIILFLGSYCSQDPSHCGESGSRLRSPQTPRAQYLLTWRHFVHKRLYLTLSQQLPVRRVLAKFIMPDQKYPPIRVETSVMPEKQQQTSYSYWPELRQQPDCIREAQSHTSPALNRGACGLWQINKPNVAAI